MERLFAGDKKGAKKESVALASIGAAKVGEDPVAYTDNMEWTHFSMSRYLDKELPCERRDFVILDQKGRPIKAAKPMHVFCGHDYKGKRDHSFRQCLNCSIIGTNIHKPNESVMMLQLRMYLATEEDEDDCSMTPAKNTKTFLKKAVSDSVNESTPSMSPEEVAEFRRYQEWRRTTDGQ